MNHDRVTVQRMSIYLIGARNRKTMGEMKRGDGVIISTLPGTSSSFTGLHLSYTQPMVLWAGEKPSMHRPFPVSFLEFLSIAYLPATQACVQYYLT